MTFIKILAGLLVIVIAYYSLYEAYLSRHKNKDGE